MLEKGDVIGPLESSDLEKTQGFTSDALVCPENMGDNPDNWKPASSYIDFGGKQNAAPTQTVPTEPSRGKLPAGDKLSIEDYFANIYQNENSQLSEILGIPDELENSDINLGRFLQRELRPDTKTKNNRLARELEKEDTRTQTRTFGPQGKILSRDFTKKDVKENTNSDFTETLKPVTARGPAAQPPAAKEEPKPAQISIPPAAPQRPAPAARQTPVQDPVTELALAKAQTLRLKNDDAPKQDEISVKQDSPEEIFAKTATAAAAARAKAKAEQPHKTASPETDPDITFNVTRTTLKAQDIAAPKDKTRRARFVLAGAVMLCLLLFLSALAFIFNRYNRQAAPVELTAAQVRQLSKPPEPVMPSPPEILPAQTPVPAVLPPPPYQAKPKSNGAGDRAVAIAQNYFLKDKNAAVGAFLDGYFTQYRRQGYTATWSSEPLHKDIYIVKYMLTKTRQEPIIYIFEVDVKKGEVTGALNNLTLDLLNM